MSAVASLLERSTYGDDVHEVNPKRLRYKTSIYNDMDAVWIVYLTERYYHRARNTERRLRPWVMDGMKAFDYALEAESSIKGAMLDKVNTQTTKQFYDMKSNTPQKGSGLINFVRGQQEE